MSDTRISQPNATIEKIDALRQQFVNHYTRDFIKSMTIEQYAMGTGKNDNFCYALEDELDDMGRIKGQSGVQKFGVWYSKKDNDYRFTKKYGGTVNIAFYKVKKEILKIIDAGELDDFNAIENNKLARLVRYKLLAMYYPHKYLTIFSKDHLSYFCSKAGITAYEGDSELVLQRKLIQWKETQDKYKDMSLLEYVAFLYKDLGRPPKKETWLTSKTSLKKLKKELSDFDRKHPKKTITQVELTQRSAIVAAYVKERAKGICQLCNKPAPFFSKNGEPYLECHHVIWISRGGFDEPSNAVALCPNCHKRMHILDEKTDVEKLKKIASK